MNWPNWKALIPWPVQPKLATLLQAAAGSCPIVARGIHPKPASEWKSKVVACYWINGQSATSPCFLELFLPPRRTARQKSRRRGLARPKVGHHAGRNGMQPDSCRPLESEAEGWVGSRLWCVLCCMVLLSVILPPFHCVVMMISPSISPIRTLVVIIFGRGAFGDTLFPTSEPPPSLFPSVSHLRPPYPKLTPKASEFLIRTFRQVRTDSLPTSCPRTSASEVVVRPAPAPRSWARTLSPISQPEFEEATNRPGRRLFFRPSFFLAANVSALSARCPMSSTTSRFCPGSFPSVVVNRRSAVASSSVEAQRQSSQTLDLRGSSRLSPLLPPPASSHCICRVPKMGQRAILSGQTRWTAGPMHNVSAVVRSRRHRRYAY